MNDLTPQERPLAPRYCHAHDAWECARIDFVDDPDPRRSMPVPKCCHAPATDGPWCRPHVPAPVPAAAV